MNTDRNILDTTVGIRYNIDVIVLDTEGNELRRERVHNILTTAGKNWIRDRINGNETDALTHFAGGTGTTAVAVGDTAMETETFRAAWTSFTDSAAQTVYQYLLPAGSNNGTTFTEGGSFDAASGGTLFNHFLYTAIAKTSSIQILFQVTLTIAEA